MDILAASVWLRYLECCGEQFRVPGQRLPRRLRAPDRRQAASSAPGARWCGPRPRCSATCRPTRPARRQGRLHRRRDRAREGAARRGRLPPGLRPRARRHPRRHPRATSSEFGVRYDQLVLASAALADNGAIDRALDAAAQATASSTKRTARCGSAPPTSATRRTASWCARTALKTYFASDIAYHLQQARARLRPADRHPRAPTTTATSRACAPASWPWASRATASRCGWCSSSRCTAAARRCRCPRARASSSRCASCAREVGNDAARFFYVMRSNDQHLDFDLELAKSQSNENPVYYIQYAHARVCSVLRQLREKGLELRRGARPRQPRAARRAARAGAARHARAATPR